MLESDGVRWAVDLGPDSYDLPGYFAASRWSYFRLNNRSHNTVTPGDALQDPRAVAPIVAFSGSAPRPFAVADLTAAYPGAARRILRGVAVPDRSRVLVQDEFTALSPGTPVRWAMVTAAAVSISPDGRSAVLSQGGRRLRAQVLEPAGPRLRIQPAAPPTPSENPNAGDSVLSLEALPGGPGDLRIAVVFTPLGGRWPAGPAPAVTAIADWR